MLSAVDHETEEELIRSLRDYGEGPTTIIVAHRVSALEHADRVIVVDDGRIQDQGTHRELIEREGLYRDIWQRQRRAS